VPKFKGTGASPIERNQKTAKMNYNLTKRWHQMTVLRIAAGLTALFMVFLFGCDANNQNRKIAGEWNAHWEMLADESVSGFDPKNLTMNGTMKFQKKGKVEIAAYGYEGCVFFADTTINTLSWEIGNDTISFIDGNNTPGLSYAIKQFNNEKVVLTMLEDITLTLSRD
jgi:hypothetical protein